MFFSMYLLEEVYDQPSDMRIATGCSGTRTGIRGQPNRCDIAEFCDHLFEPFEKPTGQVDANGDAIKNFDVKPDKDAIRHLWPRTVFEIGNMDLFKLTQAINRIRVPNPDIDRPAADYVHGIKTVNVLDGVTDYYDLMRGIGGFYVRAQQHLNAINAADDLKPARERTLKAAERRKLEKWGMEGKRGTKFVHELRLKDTAVWQMNKQKGLESKFGHPIQAERREYVEDQLKNTYGNGFAASLERELTRWQVPSKSLTVAKWKDEFSGGEPEALTKYQDAETWYFSQQQGKDHKKAFDAIDVSRIAAESVATCP